MASFCVLRPTMRPVATGGRSMDELVAASCVVWAVIAAAPRNFLSGQLASQPEDDRGTTTPCNTPPTDDAPGPRRASSAGRHTERGHA
jgi:hypothetical protein